MKVLENIGLISGTYHLKSSLMKCLVKYEIDTSDHQQLFLVVLCLVAASMAFPAFENQQQQQAAVEFEPVGPLDSPLEESDDLEGAESAHGYGGYGGGGGYG